MRAVRIAIVTDAWKPRANGNGPDRETCRRYA